MGTGLQFRNATLDSVTRLYRQRELPERRAVPSHTQSSEAPSEFTKTTRDFIPRTSDLTNGRKRTLRATSKLPLPPLPLYSPEHIFTSISRTSNQAKQFRTCSLISVPPREAPGSSCLFAVIQPSPVLRNAGQTGAVAPLSAAGNSEHFKEIKGCTCWRCLRTSRNRKIYFDHIHIRCLPCQLNSFSCKLQEIRLCFLQGYLSSLTFFFHHHFQINWHFILLSTYCKRSGLHSISWIMFCTHSHQLHVFRWQWWGLLKAWREITTAYVCNYSSNKVSSWLFSIKAFGLVTKLL